MFKGIIMGSLCLCAALSAQNLIEGDTSFEAGPDRWLGGRRVDSNGKSVLELSRVYNHSDICYALLEPGKEYTFSFRARAVRGNVSATAQIWHVLYGQAAPPQVFELTEKWQLFSMPVPEQPKTRDVYFAFRLPEGAKIEIDDLMLNAGTQPQPWSSAAPAAVDIAPTGAPGNILCTGDEVPSPEVGAVNASETPLKGELKVSTVDFYGRTRQSRDFPVELAPGKAARFPYKLLPRNAGGYYLVHAELVSGGKVLAERTMPFGVVPRPAEATPEQASFGIHPDSSRVELAALPRIGVKWVRTMPEWSWMERSRGVYTLPVEELKLMGELGMSVLFSLKTVEGMPAYAAAPDGKLADREALRRFIGVLAKELPDSVRAWEIENEADLIYPSKLKLPFLDSAEYYGRIVKLAAGYFKEAAPGKPVAAMSVSGGNNGENFIRRADAAAGGSYDIQSPHPYIGARYLGPSASSVAPDAYIRDRLLAHAKLTGGRRLWAGEVGYAYDRREAPGSATCNTFSNYVARALILMKSVPEVEKIMYFKAQGCYERDYYQYGLWRSEFEPMPAAVFYANVAEKLENSRPLPPVFESDLRVYPFVSGGGRPFAAVWRYKGDVDKLELAVPKPKVHVTDLFGNSVKVTQKGGNSVIPISETPVWVEVDGLDGAGLSQLLGEIRIDLPPVAITLLASDTTTLDGFVRNNLPRKIPVTLSAAGAEAAVFPLEPGGTKSFSLKFPKGIADPVTLTAAGDSGKTQLAFDPAAVTAVPRAASTTAVKRDMIKLAERRFIYPPDPGIAWKSPSDLSGNFGIGYDDKYFYFTADVTDPKHVQDAVNYRAWNGDSLQIAFDTLNDAQEGVFEFNDNDVEFIAWLGPEGSRLARTHSTKEFGKAVDGAKVEIVREGNHTRYRLAIPWEELGKLTPMAGRLFGLNFVVNQNNGDGRAYWLGLTEGIGEMKYPYLYRKFRLER